MGTKGHVWTGMNRISPHSFVRAISYVKYSTPLPLTEVKKISHQNSPASSKPRPLTQESTGKFSRSSLPWPPFSRHDVV